MYYLKLLRCFFVTLLLVSLSFLSVACKQRPINSLFPIEQYDQTIAHWIKPSDPNFDAPLLSAAMQQKRLDLFYQHYFGLFSPWNPAYVNLTIQATLPSLKDMERKVIDKFNNNQKSSVNLGYGENFRPYTQHWIETIAKNIYIEQLTLLHYQKDNRGIVVSNLSVRALPTDDVHFYSSKIAGQGYPFDNLQVTTLWVGTPVYIIATTQDQAWHLILSPGVIGWVKSNGIAKVDDTFINIWATAAKKKLAAITHTETSLMDESNKRFLLTAYVGTVLPAYDIFPSKLRLWIPVADSDGRAIIKKVIVSSHNAVIMPLQATPHHFALIMGTLIDRPYGWGGLYFYNDCAIELKNLFTPFGFWLPSHSSDQAAAGKTIDLSADSPKQRLSYLKKQGQPFLTIVYIGGHVFLYIGNYNDKQTHSFVAMTYQNIWGLKPNPPTRRAIIGKSVLLPLLLRYPEDVHLSSLAAKKYFRLTYLSKLPTVSVQKATVDIPSLFSLIDLD
jgi:SH3 domain (SH3b1 type)/NLPC_P60 stabilising domain, N term/SH3 domain of SH3b2 type